MLTSLRSLTLNRSAGTELPRIPALEEAGFYGTTRPRHGEVIMIAGRSGTQKSGLALFLVDEWDLPTLYCSADMSAFTASSRLACKRADMTTEQVDLALAAGGPGADFIMEQLAGSKVTFSFGSPLRWETIDQEIEAFVEVHDAYPQVFVFDNLMDFEGAEADYTAQMAVMQGATELARVTGATVLVLHHASDKTWEAKSDPWKPPARNEIKNGMAEKPELCLTVSLDPGDLSYRVATVKQRMGASDPSGNRYITLRCVPDKTTFTPMRRAA